MASDAAFFGDGSKIIETKLKVTSKKRESSDLKEYYEVERCVQWLRDQPVSKKIALQFPDELLCDSVSVVQTLQSDLPDKIFFLLADTSYGSCCVDEVAAQHYNADCLIHFGLSCLSPTSRLPVLWVFGKGGIDINDCCQKLSSLVDNESKCVLMYDVLYKQCAEKLHSLMVANIPDLILSELCDNTTAESSQAYYSVNGRRWKLKDNSKAEDYSVLYIGRETRTLTNLIMVLNQCRFFTYEPETKTARKETVKVNKSLMKRFYYIEKAKDARIVIIVTGTLGVSKYLEMHDRLRKLITKAGKKVYSIVVGKLNPAKLGNFMEADVFVLVACPENSLIDSTEFYKPIVTPYEMELACNPDRQWTGEYYTDFHTLLPGGDHHVAMPTHIAASTDVSLISGGMRRLGLEEETPADAENMTVKLRDDSLTVATRAETADEFLSNRTWKGLEQKLGQTPVEKAMQGQKGIAVSYQDEPS